MGKPRGTMSDQLKGVASKLAADKEAQLKAEKQAAQEKARRAEEARTRARDSRSDDQVFVEAMLSVERADVSRKFDAAPPPAVSRKADEKAPPPPSDEDLFSAAVGRLKQPR